MRVPEFVRIEIPSPRRRRVSAALLTLGAVLLLVASPATSADEPEGWGYALAHELMSPFCPGRTLAACTSGQAAEVRQWIVLQEAAGATREEVIETLYQRFGDVIRSQPKAEGWGLAAWALPVAALVIGIGLVYWVLRRMVGGPGAAPSPETTATATTRAAPVGDDAEFQRLIDEEMRAGEA
jgi:cytochrome c-type biogenesis protein CcmH/NrfF